MSLQPPAPDSRLFPPPITPIKLREAEDAFRVAMASAEECGAGTLFHVGRFDTVEFALVLEPEEPLHVARKIAFAGMNALGDALSQIAPPEKPLNFVYPFGILFDGADLGQARLGMPADAREDETPAFLVFAAELKAQLVAEAVAENVAGVAFLTEEGFDETRTVEFAANFCRHFMVELDEWRERGFARIGARYLSRLEKSAKGRHGIAANGDLVAEVAGQTIVLRRFAEEAGG